MHQDNISIKNLSKIEGHLDMDLAIENGQVKEVKFKIMENKRFFEKAVLGKPFTALPQLLSRICGTCSAAHQIATIEAVENALGYTPSHQTLLLRKLMTYGLMIRDHALHLYIFSLPDVLNKDSILEFDENDQLEHRLLHDMFDVKKAGNNLATIVGGRAVHAPFAAIGGFLKYPTPEEIHKSYEELIKIRDKIFLLMKVFDECDFTLKRETKFVAMKTDDYCFLEGDVLCSEGGFCVEKQYFKEQLKEVVIPYSTAKGYKVLGQEYMVGSLARMNINREALHPKTKKDAQIYIHRFPSIDIYKNNLAQAIEILHSIDHSIQILESLIITNDPVDQLSPKECEGVGLIEAPRGTLYHYVKMDGAGLVTDAEVVVPTAQNQINIENDIHHLVQDRLDAEGDSMDKEKARMDIEKLIRAYDPCMSCATHFLQINWK